MRRRYMLGVHLDPEEEAGVRAAAAASRQTMSSWGAMLVRRELRQIEKRKSPRPTATGTNANGGHPREREESVTGGP